MSVQRARSDPKRHGGWAALVLSAVLVLSACTGSGSPSSASGSSSSGPPASSDSSASAAPRHVYDVTGSSGAAFFSPDGNIVCLMGSPDRSVGSRTAFVRCDISEAGYPVPSTPPDCHGSYGLDFELARHASLGCVTDTIAPDALLRKVPAGFPRYTRWFDRSHNPRVHLAGQSAAGAGLGYGNEIVLGHLTCTSERTGVTCRNTATGKGFTVARDGYRIS